MVLWVPVGRNPTGIPKSRALPRAGGGDDTGQLGFVAELLQLDVRVDLDIPEAVALRRAEGDGVEEPGGEEPGVFEQGVDLLRAGGGPESHRPGKGGRWPGRPFPRT